IVFDSAPGYTPKVEYLYSPTTEAAIPMFINAGDLLDDNTIVIIVHKASNDSNYILANHLDDVITNVFPLYRINTNKLGGAGLNRGGQMVGQCLVNRATTFAAFIGASMVQNGTPDYANLYNKGILVTGGQNDATYTMPHTTYMVAMNSHTNWKFPPYLLFLDGVGHTGEAWNTNTFNRSTAPIDWVRWFDLFDLDVEKQTENFVDYAAETLNYDDYRRARQAVADLSAGTLKTTLEGELATIKASLDPGWVWLDIGANSSGDPSINDWATSFAAGQSKTNFTDDEGNATTIGMRVGTQFATGPTNRLQTSTRSNMRAYGFERNVFNDGANHHTTQTGQAFFTGLNPAKTYTIRFYFCHNVNPQTSDIYPSITIGGENKTVFSQCNTFNAILEFTGKVPDGSNEIGFTYNTGALAGLFQVVGIRPEN